MAGPEAKSEAAVAEGSSPPSPAPGTAKLTDLQRRLLDILRNQPEPLFALLDAARDDRVLDLLRNSGEQYQSLYEGKQGEELASFAPYLVQLPKDSRLLMTLVQEGWGKSWAVYLTCSKPVTDIRKHFRHFLIVQTEDGRELYFRFYDPRVLRLFLPTCTADESNSFFGPVRSYLLEGEERHILLQFTSRGQGSPAKVLTLASTQGSAT